MSPAAHTPSIEVRITESTLIAPFSISSGHSLSGPSAVLKPSCSSTASTGTSTTFPWSSEWKSVTRSMKPFPWTSLIWYGTRRSTCPASAARMISATVISWRAEALAPVDQRDLRRGVQEVDRPVERRVPAPTIITRLPANSDFAPTR